MCWCGHSFKKLKFRSTLTQFTSKSIFFVQPYFITCTPLRICMYVREKKSTSAYVCMLMLLLDRHTFSHSRRFSGVSPYLRMLPSLLLIPHCSHTSLFVCLFVHRRRSRRFDEATWIVCICVCMCAVCAYMYVSIGTRALVPTNYRHHFVKRNFKCYCCCNDTEMWRNSPKLHEIHLDVHKYNWHLLCVHTVFSI